MRNSLNHSHTVLYIDTSSEKAFNELPGSADASGNYLSPDGKFQVTLSPPRTNTGVSKDMSGNELSYVNMYGELIITREGNMLRDSTGNLLPDVYFYYTDGIGITAKWKDSSAFILKAHPIKYRVPANAKGDLTDVVEKQQVMYRKFRLQYTRN